MKKFADINDTIAEKAVKAYKKIENATAGGYKKIEDTVVGGYKKVETGFVEGFEKVTDKCVDTFFAKEGETIEEAKKRLTGRILS